MTKNRLKKLRACGLQFLIAAFFAAGLSQCGLIGPMAGGSSEVGNPDAEVYSSGKKDTTSKKATGVEINLQGGTIRILRDSPPAKKDSNSISFQPDSVTDSTLSIGQ